jgi:uncharacterized membrane protein YcjF (UPF0283 family)
VGKAKLTEVIREWWGLFATGVGVIVWLVRVESKGLANAREITRLWERRKEDQEAAAIIRKEDQLTAEKSRDETHRLLEEVRQDIKLLLQRGSRE